MNALRILSTLFLATLLGPAAQAQLPANPTPSRFCGIYRGIVLNATDPLLRGRVQVRVPAVEPNAEPWALPSAPIGRTFEVPAPGQEVWIAYEACDFSYPVWIGAVNASCVTTASGRQICTQD